MSELVELLQRILDRYPAQSKLEIKSLGSKERTDYGDKIIRRRYILTVEQDSLYPIEDNIQGSEQKVAGGLNQSLTSKVIK